MSLNTFTVALAGAAGMALLALPASADAKDTEAGAVHDARLGEQVDQLCIDAEGFHFHDMTDRTVVIETAGEDFLVETVKKCGNLFRCKKSLRSFTAEKFAMHQGEQFAGGGSARCLLYFHSFGDTQQSLPDQGDL